VPKDSVPKDSVPKGKASETICRNYDTSIPYSKHTIYNTHISPETAYLAIHYIPNLCFNNIPFPFYTTTTEPLRLACLATGNNNASSPPSSSAHLPSLVAKLSTTPSTSTMPWSMKLLLLWIRPTPLPLLGNGELE
jgi:hypothetical protein